MNRKPTRRDLLQFISRLQSLVGGALSSYTDRSRAQVTVALETARALCVEALAQDSAEASDPSGVGWGNDISDERYRNAL